MWKADGAPSAAGVLYEETRQLAEALLTGRDDPNQGLEALNDLSRAMNCGGCFVWQRAEFAEAAGRLPEARDLFLDATTVAISDYLIDPITRLMAHERLACVYEELDNREEAARRYAAFADAWAEADADLQTRVQEARDKAATLGGS
jgi:hypothetical protein